MKRPIALSLLTISLAACGAGNKPETADVKAVMDEVFKSCKNIKVTNVKKTNGYVPPRLENDYVVQYEYTITYRNPTDYGNLRKIYAQEQKAHQEDLGAALKQAREKATYYFDLQQKALAEGDRKRAMQAKDEFIEANNKALELAKQSENFFKNAKVYGNVPINVNRWYFDGCVSDSVKPYVPAGYIAAPPHGFILALNIGLNERESDGWFDIGDIAMKGEISLRKTDNGWRRV